jgi:signal transduction histidine kinase
VLARDTLVAVPLTLAAVFVFVIGVAVQPGGGGSDLQLVFGLFLVVLDLGPLAVRRRFPRTGLIVASLARVGRPLTGAVVVTPGVGVLILAYSVAAHLPQRRATPGLAAALILQAGGGVVVARLHGGLLDIVLVALLNTAVPALLGAYVRTRRAYTAGLEERARRLEEERPARDERAAAAERLRIARELHDVVAHHLTGMVVQAAAAERAVDRDPASVRAALRDIRSQGKATLASMRQLAGLLRRGEDAGLAPQPTLARLDDLLAMARGRGTSVDITVSGEPQPLPDAVDLTAYRLMQEGLTNAARHATGCPVAVRLTYEDEQLVVELSNTAPRTEEGHHGLGLIGMRERVEMVGGSLDIGRTETGHWRVRASLPYGRAS